MEYQVKLTDYAVEQLQEIVSYISNVLQSPETARRWLERIKLEISSLRTMPNRYPLTPEEPWRSEGIHKIPVENFLVYYWGDESQRIVWGHRCCVRPAGSAASTPEYAGRSCLTAAALILSTAPQFLRYGRRRKYLPNPAVSVTMQAVRGMKKAPRPRRRKAPAKGRECF